MDFEFLLPTKIVFGQGALNDAGKEVLACGSRVGVVSGRSSVNNGLMDTLQESLSHSSLKVLAHTVVGSDPAVEDVELIIDSINDHRIDVLIALGGGSVMDATKAASVLYETGGVADAIGKMIDPATKGIDVIAIPTTAGTGSEVTKGAIITDKKKRFKSGVRGLQVFPKTAIVDPDTIKTVPTKVMQETLFDAFTHLLETFITRKSQPITRSLSISGLSSIARLINADEVDTQSVESRALMMESALMGGINVGMAGSCLPHRLQQAMGAINTVQCSHGRGLSSVYRAWFDQVQPYVESEFATLSSLFRVRNPLDMLELVQGRLNMPVSISDVGFRHDHVEIMCDSISGAVDNDPIEGVNRSVIRDIYNSAL